MAESNIVHSPLITYVSVVSLLTLCPPFVILLWYTMVHADGSVSQTWDYLSQTGFKGLVEIWPRPTATAWKIIGCYAAFEAALQLLLPGKTVEGPISPKGNRPVYKANGVLAYAVTIVTYVGLWWSGILNPAMVYDHLGEIFSALIFGSLVFCVFLYIKVRMFLLRIHSKIMTIVVDILTRMFCLCQGHVAPSSTDSGSLGNIIIDFYWGMELYPRIGKNFDIKVFTNCRFGMMSWAVLALTYCFKQYELYGKVADSLMVNTILMLVYITKFFWWEAGYWNTMDIAHDRAGFYICWGCLVWVPSIYTSPGMYLVNHSVDLGSQFIAYFYVIYLTILLVDRATRDDDRCRSKYGKHWKIYCDKVRYRILPGIY
ncbi:7-dehydrocholesterol reductase [Linum perenne]